MAINKPFFVPQKEINLIDSMNEELIDEIVGQSVDIYKVSIDNTDENVYGESTTKYYDTGFRVNCLILFNEEVFIDIFCIILKSRYSEISFEISVSSDFRYRGLPLAIGPRMCNVGAPDAGSATLRKEVIAPEGLPTTGMCNDISALAPPDGLTINVAALVEESGPAINKVPFRSWSLAKDTFCILSELSAP